MSVRLASFAVEEWHPAGAGAVDLFHAVSGEKVAEASSQGLDFKQMVQHARRSGGPTLRAMTIHQRARMVKALGLHLLERKEQLYAISAWTGATKSDSWVDIEGGIGTLLSIASKARRELADQPFHIEGDAERISAQGTFTAKHICVPLQGVAVHINAFNFPIWGLLEKAAPSWIAGMPVIAKPATATAYLAEALGRLIVESKLLPAGAFQLITGSAGDIVEHLDEQDVVTLTGSAATGQMLRQHPTIVKNSIRFNMEADSLNCCILGADATPDSEEFGLFIKEVVREMSAKAGQKCTAIRRTLVPEPLIEPVIQALSKRLAETKIGDPAVDGVRMGPLAGQSQRREVAARSEQIAAVGERVFGSQDDFAVLGADRNKGAFFGHQLFLCKAPLATDVPHSVEAFGPVNTVMPYKTRDEAIELARRGRGSLCGSLFTADDSLAREIVLGLAPLHGRIVAINRHCAKESTGHGSPLAALVHGGPGRAGGGEELGGVRSVLHYMQRVALQGSPTTLTAITGEFTSGSAQIHDRIHPFRKNWDELQVGETLITRRRTITEADVVNFANLSGDHFYAHTDEIAAAASIFGKRVAHGYFVLAAAAGLFVDAAPGPVLANYGLDRLRFIQPVFIGDTIQVRLTVKSKTAKDPKPDETPSGVVAWDVEVKNQKEEPVAVYTILTLVARG